MKTPRKVVHMDDSAIVLEAVALVLEEGGDFEVHSARDVHEFDVALVATQPELVILDVQMPEMYGDDVAFVLRKVRDLNVPIVLFSDLDAEQLEEKARASGATVGLPKAAGLDALLETARKLVK